VKYSKISIKEDKRGQTVNLATGTIVSIMIAVLTIIFLYFTLSSLNPSALFTAGSANQNATNNLVGNFTQTGVEFGARLPTIGIMFSVLLIIAVVVIVILYLRRFQGAGAGGGGTI
jgi:hypothetical protein